VSSDGFAGVERRIQREMVDSGIPSVAIAVARHGEVLWEEAYGWADRERRIAATEHTMYSQASVSKPMTATGLMVLVERGTVDLDTPINRYLAADSQVKVWIGSPEEVTVRRVANHTAGLPRHENFYRSEEAYPRPPMEESIRRYGNVVAPPGERYRYSNFGYGILDHLIERLSGLTFADFMRREVFLPLGMTRTSVDIGPGLGDSAAVRYAEDGVPIPFYDFDHRGASAVYSSVHDLVRFGMFHLKQRQPDRKAILSDESIDAMQAPTADMAIVGTADRNLRPGSKYGIGWVIDDDDLGHRISHGGGMGGAATKLLMLPREGIVIAAAANTFCPLPYTIERDVLSALLPGYADKLAERDNEPSRPQTSVGPDVRPIRELLGDWRGTVHTYQKDLPLTLSFKPSGDVHARLGEQLATLLNDVEFRDGRLTGKMCGSIGTADASRRPHHPLHHLEVDLKLRGDVLNGVVTAIAGNALGHWVELKKDGGEP